LRSESWTWELTNSAATAALGQRLGQRLFAGAVIALDGPLGAGKTFLVRSIAEGLGIADSRCVTSPTFVLIQEHEARLPIFHFDAYRLLGEGDFFDLGIQEYFEGKGICLVEWAERVPGCLPREHLRISLEIVGLTQRRLRLEARGEKYVRVGQNLQESLVTPGDVPRSE
jgi:tRNA threonylcarbamoyladenosine biosynthesis protein TsaE